jgi:adenosylhomocysteine nucleosidase
LKVGVVAALESEARALGRARPTYAQARPAGAKGPASFANLATLSDGSMLALSGIGGAAASMAANALIEAGVAALMTFGMAGGLDPTLEAGSLLLPAEVIARDGTRLPTAHAWRERLSAALSPHCAVLDGSVLSSDVSIASPRAKAEAFRETGAAAVDMESVAVARIAADHRLPYLCVRVIVDTAADALPRAVVAASREGRVRIGRLLGGLIVAPADVVAVMRLSLRYRSAMRMLKMVARAGSLAPLESEMLFA